MLDAIKLKYGEVLSYVTSDRESLYWGECNASGPVRVWTSRPNKGKGKLKYNTKHTQVMLKPQNPQR
jgi:hypothetical protein